MSQQRGSNSSEWLIPHTCRPEAEPETDARPEAERDPAVEAYLAHRRLKLDEALADPLSPVTGPVRDPKSMRPSWETSWENLEAQLVDGPYRRYLSLDGKCAG